MNDFRVIPQLLERHTSVIAELGAVGIEWLRGSPFKLPPVPGVFSSSVFTCL